MQSRLAATLLPLAALGAAVALAAAACGTKRPEDAPPPPDLDAGEQDQGVLDTDFVPEINLDTDRPDVPTILPDPKTCEEAAANRSYVGCDFWPTVGANSVWETFDFAAIVANAGDTEAKVSVTGPGGFTKEAIVGPNRIVKIYLPWVKELKGKEADACGRGAGIDGSVRVNKGAYHVVTTRPVAVYQFNALQYKGEGGAPGKDWKSCPGNKTCIRDDGTVIGAIGCYSFTNDASLLLPSTALTGNYRITGEHGATGVSSYVVVTGTRDGTKVDLTLGPKARVLAGGDLPFTTSGTVSFKLDAGDVFELVAGAYAGSDLSGSVIKADGPVQVVAGVPCITVPSGEPACDHVEESVFPAETMGKSYLVASPTGPSGNTPGHVVRFYGNVDGTNLTYKPGRPTGAPTVLNAGQVVEIAKTTTDFLVTGDQPFAVSTLMLGGSLADPTAFDGMQRGDPSMSMVAATEQYRVKYVFLAPDDYEVSYADVVAPKSVKLQLDGKDVATAPSAITGTGYDIYRIKLTGGVGGDIGAHSLTASKPVGLQVIGYGLYTSYQYPGGLNLAWIAPPPK